MCWFVWTYYYIVVVYLLVFGKGSVFEVGDSCVPAGVRRVQVSPDFDAFVIDKQLIEVLGS